MFPWHTQKNQNKTLLWLMGLLVACLPVFPMEVISVGLKQWEQISPMLIMI